LSVNSTSTNSGRNTTNPSGAVPTIRLSGIVKRYERADGEEVLAVNGVSLDVKPGEFMVLLGPSGCGKTTLLRSIAGLEPPDQGEIELDGRTVFSVAKGIDVPPEQRGVAMFFQSYALWPHMTVFENVAYPLRSRNIPNDTVTAKVTSMLERVRCGHLAGQHPGEISGGQQQRVALARTLISGSKIVLFDEPMSNVDAAVRAQLRIELIELQRLIGFSALYITHDQSEALALANRIAILSAGRIVQLAPPVDLYRRPNSAYVARFLGSVNESAGRVTGFQQGQIEIHTPVATIHALVSEGEAAAMVGRPVTVIGRPEHYRLTREQPAGQNTWQVTIRAILFLGTLFEYAVDLAGTSMRVWLISPADVQEGSLAWLSIEPENLMVFDEAAPKQDSVA